MGPAREDLKEAAKKFAAHLAQFVEEIRWWDARTIRLNFPLIFDGLKFGEFFSYKDS